MPRSRPPYSPEFRRQMVELVRAGGDPEDLSREFEPTSPSIRNWGAQSDRQEGRRAPQADLLGMAERDELIPACESHDFRRAVSPACAERSGSCGRNGVIAHPLRLLACACGLPIPLDG